jgi:replicative DNA helicase
MPEDLIRTDGTLQHDYLKIEAGLLGAAIINPEYVADIADLPKDFFTKAAHRDLALTLKELWLADQPIDIACVHAAIQAAARTKTSLLDLADMTGDAVSLNFTGHLQLLEDWYTRRKIKHVAAQLSQKAFTLSENADEMVGNAIQDLTNLMQSDEATLKHFWEIANPLIIRGESGRPQEPGVPSGLGGLDRALGGGFKRGTLNVLAARPAMGKSALALQWSVYAARQGYQVLFISLEMSAENLIMRLAGSETGIEPSVLRQTVAKEPWAKVREAMTPLANLPLWICDNSSITSSRAIALAKELKAKQGLDLVIVDYLQRFVDTLRERHVNRNHLVGGISKAFANLARQAECAVILVSQLNRKPDSSADKKPSLADLRDSGEIEQDADTVALLWREGYYDSKADQTKTELILAKNREGPTGPEPLYWDAAKVRFFSTERRD